MNLKKEDNTIKIVLIGLLIVLAIAVFPIKQASLTETGSANGKTIVVSGDYEKTVAPDLAKAYITIETVKDTAELSQEENAKTSKVVREALEAIVGKENIETNQYYLNEKYEWDDELRKSEVVGFMTIHTLEVKIEDITKVGEVLDKAVRSGATNVNNINFELSQSTEKQLREELLGLAAKEAKSKADSLSDALGVEILGVKSVSESTFNAYPYVYRGYAETAMADSAGGIMKTNTEINPQNIEVSATVSVIYSID